MTSESKNEHEELVVIPNIFLISQQSVLRSMSCPHDA